MQQSQKTLDMNICTGHSSGYQKFLKYDGGLLLSDGLSRGFISETDTPNLTSNHPLLRIDLHFCCPVEWGIGEARLTFIGWSRCGITLAGGLRFHISFGIR